MKKMILAIAAVMISAGAMAQEEKKQREVRKPMDKMEMVQKRTEQMVKKYELNETQAGQLLEVNKEFADKMGHRMQGQRQGAHRGKMYQRAGKMKPMEKLQKVDKDSVRMKPMDGQKMRKQMQETREAYDAKLKEIMTEEQFKAYKADEEKRPARPMRQRMHEDRNN